MDRSGSGRIDTRGGGGTVLLALLLARIHPESLATQITAGARAFRCILTPLQREIYFVIRVVL